MCSSYRSWLHSVSGTFATSEPRRRCCWHGSSWFSACTRSGWAATTLSLRSASANRFIAQGVPALIILSAIVIERSIAGGPPRIVASWSSVASVPDSWDRHPGPHQRRAVVPLGGGQCSAAAVRHPQGAGRARHCRPTPRRMSIIAVHAAGQIPYYSQRSSIDLLGLNDPVIARGPRRTSFYPGHDKWNYEYSIGQQLPDLIADNWIRLR